MMKLYVESGWNEDEDKPYTTFVDAPYTCHFVYAHGMLEYLAGYDIVSTVEDNFDFVNDRIEQVIAVLPDGQELPATLFFWHEPLNVADGETEYYRKKHPTYRCHGRVVLNDDFEYLADARDSYNRKSL